MTVKKYIFQHINIDENAELLQIWKLQNYLSLNLLSYNPSLKIKWASRNITLVCKTHNGILKHVQLWTQLAKEKSSCWWGKSHNDIQYDLIWVERRKGSRNLYNKTQMLDGHFRGRLWFLLSFPKIIHLCQHYSTIWMSSVKIAIVHSQCMLTLELSKGLKV